VYPAVLEIARKHESGFVRALAADCLGTIGSARDFELLEGLATDDPYTAVCRTCTEAPAVVYPVRSAAKGAIQKLRKAGAKPDPPSAE
ncbi:MAG TPA: HEAT repeat domain-containing protein, partial [Pirellulales bacterium]